MCARRFLIAVFILTLLLVAAGFALFQWGGNILLKRATPTGHFQAKQAGDRPDYASRDDWISNPALDPFTDVAAALHQGALDSAREAGKALAA